MTTASHRRAGTPPGILLHSPRLYDFQVWLATRGQERSLREAILSKAHLQPGEKVLDVGCGTGVLAVAAKRLVGSSGAVIGVDASPEMTAAARAKALRANVDIEVQTALAQALPFPDDEFDLVASTLMLHHLPPAGRDLAAAEMRRVLKPGGRALVVDFATSSEAQGGFLHHLHPHGRVRPEEIARVLTAAGLVVAEAGTLGMRDLHYIRAVKVETAP